MFTHEVLADFNDLELSIYNCILENKENITNLTIKDLAEAAHVSTSTVLRFCKKLGFEGYTHFKLRYKESLRQEEIMLKDTDDIVLKNFVYRTESNDFQKKLKEAVDILKDSKQIIFIGIGSSGTLGRYGARFFSNIGHFSLYVEDPWQPILQNLAEKTVAIALSESGTTMQTIDIAHQIKERGSILIAITNTTNSTLAKMADCNISYHVPELIVNKANITTQLPVIYIIETLARNLYRVSK